MSNDDVGDVQKDQIVLKNMLLLLIPKLNSAEKSVKKK